MKNKKQKNNKKQQNAIVESLDTKIAKLAHIRMDFRGIMQSAWTRKG